MSEPPSDASSNTGSDASSNTGSDASSNTGSDADSDITSDIFDDDYRQRTESPSERVRLDSESAVELDRHSTAHARPYDKTLVKSKLGRDDILVDSTFVYMRFLRTPSREPPENIALEAKGSGYFFVSTKVMRLASPLWNYYFKAGGFLSKQRSLTTTCEFFKGDDRAALLVLLRIAHYQFDRLRETLIDYRLIYQLVLLSNRYMVQFVVRPWLNEWKKPFIGTEIELGPNETWHGWLEVATTLGDVKTYESVAQKLTMICSVNRSGTLLDEYGRRCGSKMPAESDDNIAKARLARIEKLLGICYELVDRYKPRSAAGPVCVLGEKKCDSLVHRSFQDGLKQLRLLPKVVNPNAITKSVASLRTQLIELPCDNYHKAHSDEQSRTSSPVDCSFTKILKESLKCLDNAEPSPLSERYRFYLAAQA